MRILRKFILSTFFLGVLIYGSFQANAEPESSTIIVDIAQTNGPVNREVLGQNLLGFGRHADYGAGIWDSRGQGEEVKNVIETAKGIGIAAVRFPGGDGADKYDWKKAIGKERKNFLFGIDEFLQVAKDIGATPIYTISYFTGTEHDAADLVEYLDVPDNGQHPWALERTKNGHQDPYSVKYFEIGNEVYYKIAPGGYVKEYLKYYDAMKSIDPTVQIGIVLNDESWNRVVIAAIGNKVDFGIIHVYPTPDSGKKLETMSSSEIFDVSLAQSELQYQVLFDEVKELFKKYSGREVPLAITEFNGGFAQDKPVPYRYTLGNGLINAELLKLFMKPENNILMSNNWNFVNEYWGMIANGFQGNVVDLNNPYYKRPNYYAFELYAKHFGELLLKTDVKSDGYSIEKYDELTKYLKPIKSSALVEPNLLNSNWQIREDPGVLVTQDNGVLQINFEKPLKFNYYHTSKSTQIEPGDYYKLSGYIRTENLVDKQGVCLEIQDARGWNVTHSAEDTDKITDTNDWQYVDMIYKALPNAKAVNVIARRIGETGPLQGKVFFKDVKLEKFIPSLNIIPYLSINASKSLDGKKVYLMVINKNLDELISTTIELKNFSPVAKANAWVLNGPSIDATNEENHDNVKVNQHEFVINGSLFKFNFEPHSLTAIEIERTQ